MEIKIPLEGGFASRQLKPGEVLDIGGQQSSGWTIKVNGETFSGQDANFAYDAHGLAVKFNGSLSTSSQEYPFKPYALPGELGSRYPAGFPRTTLSSIPNMGVSGQDTFVNPFIQQNAEIIFKGPAFVPPFLTPTGTIG